MSMYTFAQFEEAAKKAGLYGRMNEADIKLAQKNPDAGMSILSGIQEYQKATTPEQRALIHEQVEGVRKNYGGYSGGKDGSAFSILNTPSSFTPNATPDRNYSAVAGNAYNKLTGYGDYQGSKWQGNIDSIGNKIAGYEDYSFNPETSELSKALRKQYAREIGRATEDTMASAAALTGGLPSSYAATAGAQAGDYYASQYVDKLQDVANLEHAIYQANFSKEMNKLAAMQNLEETEYQRYLDQYDRLLSEYEAGLNLDAQNERVYQNDVSQNNYENEFAYGQLIDQNKYNETERDNMMSDALNAAEYGDYSFLNQLGIDTSAYEKSTADAAALDRAIALAELGDYSALKALGVDTTRLEAADREAATGSDSKISLSDAKWLYDNLGDDTLLRRYYAQNGLPYPGGGSDSGDIPTVPYVGEEFRQLISANTEAAYRADPKYSAAMVIKDLNTMWVEGADKKTLQSAINDAKGIVDDETLKNLAERYGVKLDTATTKNSSKNPRAR